MPSGRQIRNVSLIGFMGAGKTTVGHLLAEVMGFELIDTDRVIEKRTQRRIQDIFATDGEPAFRALENQLVLELESSSRVVISTGGGLVVNRANLLSLRKHSLVTCLWASPETIFERVKSQTHRPLLNAPDPLGKIRDLLVQRAPYYKEADLLVGVDFRAPQETVRHIAAAFARAVAFP